MIELHDVGFSYGNADVLRGVSLVVRPGERVVLLGRNGSGKSTLSRLMNGSLLACSGEVVVDGITSAPETRGAIAAAVGYVRQDPRNQIVSPLVRDEVEFGPRNLALPREEVRARAEGALAACGLEALRLRMTDELSGGQQQLLSLAGVLAMSPRYLVLDEVGSHLDEAARTAIAGLVRGLVRGGTGVLEVAHGPETLFGASRAVVLEGGRIAWEGRPEGLLRSERALRASGLSDDPLTAPLVELVTRGGMLGESPDPAALADVLTVRDASREVVGRPERHRLSLERASVSYDDLVALDDVTFSCSGVTLLLGASGSGKTTAARVLAGVLAPDEGEASLDGAPVRAGEVGLSFQRPEDQLFADTVLEDLSFAPRMLGLGHREADARARDAAERLGVTEDLLDRSPFELSGGQMRRVALAGVLAAHPRACVLDEPSAGLDAPARRSLRELVSSLAREGVATLVVTHDAAEWLDVADDVVLLVGGRVVARVGAEEAARSPELFRAAGMEPPLLVRARAMAWGERNA